MNSRRTLWLTMLPVLALAGCATFKDELVAPTGDLANCQSTGGGLLGMAVAANANSSCVDTFRGRGYKPAAEAVATGIVLSKDEIPAKILAVTEDSPAARAGLRTGDTIVSVDGNAVTNRLDAGKYLSNGAVGPNTTITVKRGDQDLTVTVGRVPYLSLRAKS